MPRNKHIYIRMNVIPKNKFDKLKTNTPLSYKNQH